MSGGFRRVLEQLRRLPDRPTASCAARRRSDTATQTRRVSQEPGADPNHLVYAQGLPTPISAPAAPRKKSRALRLSVGHLRSPGESVTLPDKRPIDPRAALSLSQFLRQRARRASARPPYFVPGLEGGYEGTSAPKPRETACAYASSPTPTSRTDVGAVHAGYAPYRRESHRSGRRGLRAQIHRLRRPAPRPTGNRATPLHVLRKPVSTPKPTWSTVAKLFVGSPTSIPAPPISTPRWAWWFESREPCARIS